MAHYVVPQVLVFQEFSIIPRNITQALRAHISGPHAHLRRYSDPDDKPSTAIGDYDPTADSEIEWPEKPNGASIDDGSVKLYFENARLQYFEDLVGLDETVAPVAGRVNQVRIGGTYGFKSNGPFARIPALGDRDVQVNDKVTVQGGGSRLDSYVAGIAADQVAAVINPGGGSIADAGNNWGTQAGSEVVTYTGSPALDNCNTLAADITGYSALADGYLTDTYTVEVVQGSTGNDLSTARLRITTASGQDDDLVAIPANPGTDFEVGRRGLILSYSCATAAGGLSGDNLVVGQKWRVVVNDNYVAVVATTAGTYTGDIDTTYIVTVSKGGYFGDPDPSRRPQISVRTAHGVDASGPTTVPDVAIAVPIGTKGVTLTFTAGPAGVRKGDRYYIPVKAAQDGRMGILQLGHSLPVPMRAATDLDISLAIEKDIQVEQFQDDGTTPNFEVGDAAITIKGGIVGYDEGFEEGGLPFGLRVTSASMFVEYRAWLQELVDQIGTISDIADLDDMISGPLSPENPLKWGVRCALMNSNGTDVKFSAVRDPDEVSAWLDVVQLVVGRDDIYNLVPLTYDREVLNAFTAHVDAQSSPENGRWRATIIGLQGQTHIVRTSDETTDNKRVVMATIADDPLVGGTQYTYVEVRSGNGNFLEAGVRPGDILRTNFGHTPDGEIYDEYVIDRIVSNDVLVLADGPVEAISLTGGQKIEVWHPQTKTELAESIAFTAGTFHNRRVVAVWPDKVASGGTWFDGYHVAAAIAGLRSGVPPHAALTNTEVAGFDDVSRSAIFFNATQLNIMAGAGVWVVTQSPDGVVYTRHGLTTDNLDVNSSEEMVRANVDSMSYVFLNQLSPFIGRMNVTPLAISLLKVELEQVISYLKSGPYPDRLGPQLIDATIVQLRRHNLMPDRVVAVINLAIPYPLNNLEVHLVI